MLLAALGCSWLLLAAASCHGCPHPRCIFASQHALPLGVAFRVVVVALVVAQPAADARSRRARRIACEHDTSQLLTLALGWSGLLEPFVVALSWVGLRVASHCSFKLLPMVHCRSLLADHCSIDRHWRLLVTAVSCAPLANPAMFMCTSLLSVALACSWLLLAAPGCAWLLAAPLGCSWCVGSVV